MRGRSTEPVKLRPGIEVRDAAHSMEIEQWAWQRVQSMRAFYTHLMIYCVVNFALLVPLFLLAMLVGSLYSDGAIAFLSG